jgi:hypothetical protein
MLRRRTGTIVVGAGLRAVTMAWIVAVTSPLIR